MSCEFMVGFVSAQFAVAIQKSKNQSLLHHHHHHRLLSAIAVSSCASQLDPVLPDGVSLFLMADRILTGS